MQNLRVEYFKEGNVSDILKLERELFEDPYSEETLRRELELPFSVGLVAKLEGKIVGYCLAWIVDDTCEIHRIGVAENLQGKGVGRKLLTSLLEISRKRGVKQAILEVSEKNKKAISFYRNLGFSGISERKNYYGKEKALLMKLNLGG